MSGLRVRSALLSILTLALLGAAIPAAHAQLDLPGTDSGGGALPDTGTVTDPIQEVTDPITGDDGADLGDVTDPITGGGDPIGEVTDPITEPIEDATEPITGSGSDLTEETTDTVNDTIGGIGGGSLDTLEGTLGGSTDGDSDGGKSGVKDKEQGTSGLDGTGRGYYLSGGFDVGGLRATGPDNDGTSVRTIVQRPAAGFESPAPSVVAQIARAAVEAAKKLAFPLTLLGMVGLFLVLQGRLDRRDPKLASAPIDAEQDTLSFR